MPVPGCGGPSIRDEDTHASDVDENSDEEGVSADLEEDSDEESTLGDSEEDPYERGIPADLEEESDEEHASGGPEEDPDDGGIPGALGEDFDEEGIPSALGEDFHEKGIPGVPLGNRSQSLGQDGLDDEMDWVHDGGEALGRQTNGFGSGESGGRDGGDGADAFGSRHQAGYPNRDRSIGAEVMESVEKPDMGRDDDGGKQVFGTTTTAAAQVGQNRVRTRIIYPA